MRLLKTPEETNDRVDRRSPSHGTSTATL
jgi:hypothetical protein